MEQKVNIVSRQKNKSFCVLPWIHLATHPIGTVTPCCITDMKDGVSTAAHEDNDNADVPGSDAKRARGSAMAFTISHFPLNRMVLTLIIFYSYC